MNPVTLGYSPLIYNKTYIIKVLEVKGVLEHS